MLPAPKATYAYTVLVAAIAVTALFLLGMTESVPWYQLPIGGMAVLIGVGLVAGYLEIPFPIRNGSTFNFTVDAAIALATGIILGPLWGAILVMISTIILDLLARRALLKLVVNVLTLGLSTLAAAIVYRWLSDGSATPFANRTAVAALVAASLVYTLVNTSVLAVIVGPVVDMSPLEMWTSNLRPLMVELITLPSLGGIVPILYNEHPLAPALFIVPLAGPFLAFRALRQVERETRATLESLADVLEQRDRYTHHHSVRVTGYVGAMLDQMPQVPVQTRDIVLSAARIHDVGKVGISDSTLNKPGKLTHDEWREIQRHPEIGSQIMRHLAIYRDEATIVRHHHERWDGSGYPDGLAANDIPLGSRLIAVADAFDAMTSDRAYRGGMSAEVALSVIRDGAGAQFDPDAVGALERALCDGTGSVALPKPTPVAGSLFAAERSAGVVGTQSL